MLSGTFDWVFLDGKLPSFEAAACLFSRELLIQRGSQNERTAKQGAAPRGEKEAPVGRKRHLLRVR